MKSVETVGEAARAELLFHPLRREVLRLATGPVSATELARLMSQPRQKVNYHVRQLEKGRFLRKAGRRRRRNAVEQRYVATARAYAINPAALGELGADWRQVQDAMSADYLVALAAQMQAEVSAAAGAATAEGRRLATLSLNADVRFTSGQQQRVFAEALTEAITGVIARHAAPASESEDVPGKTFRLVIGCYPQPEVSTP